jgi:elongator complex protein 1
MYKETLKTKSIEDGDTEGATPNKQDECKVNRICDAFLAVLEQEQHRDHHLQNIITSHVFKASGDAPTSLLFC